MCVILFSKGLDSEIIKVYPNCQLISDDCECFIIEKEQLLNCIPRKLQTPFQTQV